MAKSKPRRATIGRGLPPPPRRTPEEEAEDERIRAWIIVRGAQNEAIFARKRREAEEQKRLKALQQTEALNDPAPWS
jgi:hypothetical protein